MAVMTPKDAAHGLYAIIWPANRTWIGVWVVAPPLKIERWLPPPDEHGAQAARAQLDFPMAFHLHKSGLTDPGSV